MISLDEFIEYFKGGENSPGVYSVHDPVTYETLECASCLLKINEEDYVIRYEVRDIVMYKCVVPLEEMIIATDIDDYRELDSFIKEAHLKLSGNTQYNELLELAKRLTE